MNFRLVGAVALASAVLFAPNSFAGTVTITDYSGANPDFFANGGNGGPFTATTAGVGPLGISSFLTFCLELNETVSLGSPYNYTVSTAAVLGGNGGPSDPVSDATKFLYYQARTGGYTAVFGNVLPAVPTANAGALLQLAIWHLEGEQTATGDALNLANYAATTGASAWAGIFASGYNVGAINLTDANGNLAQSMLGMSEPGITVFNVPDGGTTLTLLGMAMGGIAIASRRLRRR